MDTATAEGLADLLLDGVAREFPNKPDHLVLAVEDVAVPRALHPAFYGCLDWHSAVHSHWALLRLLRTVPGLPQAHQVRETLGEHLTAANLEAEAAYLAHPERGHFERPYGWVWLLRLAAEATLLGDADGRGWSGHLEALVDLVDDRLRTYLRGLPYPVRAGTHPNTAFALALAIDSARILKRPRLEADAAATAGRFYRADTAYPAHYEPGGADFLSPALVEADLMTRVLDQDAYERWLVGFLPGIARAQPATLFHPPVGVDPADPTMVHLDGLSLSRAWCQRGIARALPAGHPLSAPLLDAAARHARHGLTRVVSGQFMGEHWLPSFAVYLDPEL